MRNTFATEVTCDLTGKQRTWDDSAGPPDYAAAGWLLGIPVTTPGGSQMTLDICDECSALPYATVAGMLEAKVAGT